MVQNSIQAFWISPNCLIIPVPNHHIDLVINDPKRFGYTKNKIFSAYKKYNEPLFHEGFARDEIMADLLENGWVRIRYVEKKDSFTIQLNNFDNKNKLHLKNWLEFMTTNFGTVSKYTGIEIKTATEYYSGTIEDLVGGKIEESLKCSCQKSQ
jgi:hypothetical protein